jgi:tetratricopeptide (TPR) repeat protein
MSESVTTLFEQGLERYQAGEDLEKLIPFFKDICDRAPKNSSAWSCLAWLYLLSDRPKLALKAAQKSVKLDGRAPQARINLVLAMLDAGQAGVRQHIEIVQEIIGLEQQIRNDVEENIEDGLSRKPDWKSLQRVKNWLIGA